MNSVRKKLKIFILIKNNILLVLDEAIIILDQPILKKSKISKFSYYENIFESMGFATYV